MELVVNGQSKLYLCTTTSRAGYLLTINTKTSTIDTLPSCLAALPRATCVLAWRVLIIREEWQVINAVRCHNHHLSLRSSWSYLSLQPDKRLTIRARSSSEPCHPPPRGHTPPFVARLDCEALKVCLSWTQTVILQPPRTLIDASPPTLPLHAAFL